MSQRDAAQANAGGGPSVFSAAARAFGLGLPLVIVGAAVLTALAFVTEGGAGDRVLALLGQTALLAGGALALALPLALALVARDGKRRRKGLFFTLWGAVPPVVTGILVGALAAQLEGLGLSSVALTWGAAMLATALAILPRLVLDVGTAVEGSNAIVLIDAALALGARGSAALRLALASELGAWRSIGAAATAAIGDGVAVLAALALVGGVAPDAVGLGLLAGDPTHTRGVLGLCLCLVLASAAAAALRGPARVREASKAPMERGVMVRAANVEGLR